MADFAAVNLHGSIINIMAELKYRKIYKIEASSQVDGLCKGIAMMAVQAIIVGQIQEFQDRIRFIAEQGERGIIELIQAAEQLKKIAKANRSPRQKNKIAIAEELLGFFDGIALYARPIEHQYLFETPFPSQQHETKIAKIVQSQAIKEQTQGVGLIKTLLACDTYTQKELSGYIACIGRELRGTPGSNVAISVCSGTHAITIAYNTTDGWRLIDANTLGQSIKSDNVDVISGYIRAAFEIIDPSKSLPISTAMLTLREDERLERSLKQSLDVFKANALQKTLTPQDGNMVLWLAAQDGNLETVSRLLDTGKCDINAPGGVGTTPLYIAAKNGHVEVVGKLLDNEKCEINEATPNGLTPLYTAAYSGHLEVVRLLIAKGCKVAPLSNGKATPLYIAAQNGHVEIMLELLSTGRCDINQATSDGATPLCIAACNGHSEVVKILLRNNSEINKPTNDGLTPLYFAAQSGNLEIVQALLEVKGCAINQATNTGSTPLEQAVQNGYLAVVDTLIAAGANIAEPQRLWAKILFNAVNKEDFRVVGELIDRGAVNINECAEKGSTPMSIAEANGDIKMVEVLIVRGAAIVEPQRLWSRMLVQAVAKNNVAAIQALVNKGANINEKDKQGNTLLHNAAMYSDLETVRILIEAGAKVDEKDTRGRTSLLMVVTSMLDDKSTNPEVIKTLLAAGANVDELDKNGQTPLSMAIVNNRPDIVQVLKYKETQLAIAVETGNLALVETLIQTGAKVNEENKHGLTPLAIAINNGNLAMVETLIKNGADVNKQDQLERTPVSVAVEKGNLDIVKILMKAGVDINKADTHGLTPLDIAKDSNLTEIITILVNAGAKIASCSTSAAERREIPPPPPNAFMHLQEKYAPTLNELTMPDPTREPEEPESEQKKDKDGKCNIS